MWPNFRADLARELSESDYQPRNSVAVLVPPELRVKKRKGTHVIEFFFCVQHAHSCVWIPFSFRQSYCFFLSVSNLYFRASARLNGKR